MKLFKNRFGRQPLWWHFLNLIRLVLSIFFKRFRLEKKKKYEVKRKVGPLRPKKWDSRDIRKVTAPALCLALAGLTWGINYSVTIEPEDLPKGHKTQVEEIAAANANTSDQNTDKETVKISSYSLEQIENLANTIAGQNAIWPGYKGDPKDPRAVNRHFQENFAKFINGGTIPVEPWMNGRSVAFAYAVTADGTIVFVGAIPGGTITADENPDVYEDINQGISGRVKVLAAQDEGGEEIIMLYYIKVKFSIQ